MRSATILLLFGLAFALSETAAVCAQKQPEALAGWYDVFPHSMFFGGRRFHSPVVAKTKDGQPTYSQSMTYDAATGLVRSFDVKLLRDPEIKVRYAPEFLRAQEDPPKESKVGNYRAWTWKDGKVVVVLDEDKAVVITKAPKSVAGLPFDQVDNAAWDKMAEALKNPPRTDFTPTLDTFRALKKGSSSLAMNEWCGYAKDVKARPDAPGSFLATYVMADGSRVLVGFGRQIEFIRHETKDGKVTELLK